MLEPDLMIGFHTARLMAGEKAETGTIDTEKNSRILEIGQDIPHKFWECKSNCVNGFNLG
jgi:hypothetical protein